MTFLPLTPVRSLRLACHAALVCLGASASIASRAGAGDCPTSTITMLGCPTISTQAAAMDAFCPDAQFQYTDAHFDLLATTLALGVQPDGFQGSGEVVAAERYRIVGTAPGTPVAFTLRMPISAALQAAPADVLTRSTGA